MTLPKVSAQLPTGYGDRYVHVAINCFLAQDYKGELELILLDNNQTPIRHDFPDDARIKYHRCDKAPIGKLRNIANDLATGEIIVHFDEDDWSSADRVGHQVDRILASGKAMTGFHNALFFDTSDGTTWKYHYAVQGSHPAYAFGASHCYRRDFWDKHRFNETGVEDWPFTQQALWAKQLDSCDGDGMLVVRSHRDSTCYPQFGSPQFPKWERGKFPQQFFADTGGKQ